MSNSKKGDDDGLRSSAEKRLANAVDSGSLELLAGESTNLIHELQVHQIELELQNEELVRVQSELETALKDYHDLYEYAPDGYISVDEHGTILKLNIAAAELFDRSKDEMLNAHFPIFVAEKNEVEVLSLIKLTFSNRNSYLLEREIDKRSLPSITVELKSVFAEKGPECHLVVRDITERKNYEKLQEEAKQTAVAASKAKSLFLARMSHELRTPLNSIIGYSRILLEKLEPQAFGKYADAPKIINKAGHSLLSLVNDILDISKVERETVNLKIQSCNLESVVNDSINLCSQLRENVEVNKVNLNISVMADPARLQQVIVNLLTNALKYNRNDNPIDIVANEKGKKVTLSFFDRGIGINDKERDLLFQPFSRLSDAIKSEVEGQGIGLTLSKSLMEAMHGSIGMESVEGEGSRFFISLSKSVENSLD